MGKDKCSRCGEFREFLNKENICSFCIAELRHQQTEGTEIKSVINMNIRGKEIKSRNGIDDNAWMR